MTTSSCLASTGSDLLGMVVVALVLLVLGLAAWRVARLRSALVVLALVGGGLDVRGDLQDLLEALALVLALGEAEPGPRDAREGLRPPPEGLLADVGHRSQPTNAYATALSRTSSSDATTPE